MGLLNSTQSPCLSCQYCAQLHPGPKRKGFSHPCLPYMPKADNPLNPPEYRWQKSPFKLYSILRAVTSREFWKRYIRPTGYQRRTHFKPKIAPCTHTSRISRTLSPITRIRRELRMEAVVPARLDSLPPRITTIAAHGPGALLRPFFPEFPEVPDVGQHELTQEDISAIFAKQRASLLAGTKNLSLGGHGSTIAELEVMEPLPVTEELEDLEPLRAMSLREVTNIDLLKKYNAK